MDTKVLVIIVIIAVAAAGIVYAATGVEDVRTYEMQVKVKTTVAFDLDPEALHFGGAPAGSGLERGIEVKNQKSYPLRVDFYAKGEITDWLRSFENSVVIEPNEARNISFYVDIPVNAVLGTYNGTLLLETRRVWI